MTVTSLCSAGKVEKNLLQCLIVKGICQMFSQCFFTRRNKFTRIVNFHISWRRRTKCFQSKNVPFEKLWEFLFDVHKSSWDLLNWTFIFLLILETTNLKQLWWDRYQLFHIFPRFVWFARFVPIFIFLLLWQLMELRFQFWSFFLNIFGMDDFVEF